MAIQRTRRAFLRNAAAGGTLLGCASMFPDTLGTAAARTPDDPEPAVSLRPDIEPLVRLLEETPRAKLVEVVADRVRGGLAYQELLGALLLAGVRNVEPRPSVGFKFHAVLVVQSVHLASMACREQDRWLPIFWALDYFKDSQARDERERGWTMAPVDESAMPSGNTAKSAFVEAIEAWNEPATDVAISGLARTAPPKDVWELLFGYGARDYRSIGHKAIDVANTHRVLDVIGWRHAEPPLRSLAYALLMHEDGNPAERDDRADRPWRRNPELAERFPDAWQQGRADRNATLELLKTLRDGSEDRAAQKVADLVTSGVGPQPIWDALFLGAMELLIRQPGIVALHSVTTTNSLYYAYRLAREDSTRRLLLLQNAAFLPMFRDSMRDRGQVRPFSIDTMEPLGTGTQGTAAVDEIFSNVGRDSMDAARKTLAYILSGGAAKPWIDVARRLIIEKSTGAHDYKFGCAVLEDAEHVSEEWRGLFLGGAVFSLQGDGKRDNPLIQKARTALDE